MTAGRASLLLFATGWAIAAVGISVYEAWWTAGFAAGGALVAVVGPRLASPFDVVAVAAGASGAAVLAGVSVFLLFGVTMGGGVTWLAGAVGAIVAAVLLARLVRRLLATAGAT